MKVKVLKAFYATKTGTKKKDDVFELPDEIAGGFISHGFVEAVNEPVQAVKQAKTETGKAKAKKA